MLDPFRDFLIACVGASASFIGLLFVALSVVLARTDSSGNDLAFSDRRLAESAFTALANIFFVCLIALMPGANIDYVAFIMSLIGLRNSFSLIIRLKKNIKSGEKAYRQQELYWISTSIVIYALQAIYAVRIFLKPANISNLYVMMAILLCLFAGGLIRSWELTGIRSS